MDNSFYLSSCSRSAEDQLIEVCETKMINDCRTDGKHYGGSSGHKKLTLASNSIERPFKCSRGSVDVGF